MATKEEIEREQEWIKKKCIFDVGDVIEWTECIAVITDIWVEFPSQREILNNFTGVNVSYQIEWIAHPQLEAQERLSHKFSKDEAKAYNIKLASERWQVLYGKTKV